MIVSQFVKSEILAIGCNPTCGFCALCDFGGGVLGVIELVFARWQLFEKRDPKAQARNLICSDIDGIEVYEPLRCLLGDSVLRVSSIYREMSDAPDFGYHVLVEFCSGKLLYVEPYDRPDQSMDPPMYHAPMIVFTCSGGKQTYEFSGNVNIEIYE